MDSEKQAQVVRRYDRANEAANALHTQAKEVYEMASGLEDLTKDTTIWSAGLRVQVEARTVREQAEDLRRVLEPLKSVRTPALFRQRSIALGRLRHCPAS